MQERLANLADVFFGVLLTAVIGFVDARIALAHPQLLSSVSVLFATQFIVLCYLWAIQAAVLRHSFIDHAIYNVFFFAFLYSVAGWAAIDQSSLLFIDKAPLQLTISRIGLDSMVLVILGLFILLVLQIAGFAYRYERNSRFETYQQVRLSLGIVAGLGYCSALNALHERMRSIFDIMVVTSFALALSLFVFLALEAIIGHPLRNKSQFLDDLRKRRAVEVLLVVLVVAAAILLFNSILFSWLLLILYVVFAIFVVLDVIKVSKEIDRQAI